jgi:hypothetical protein
MSDVRNHNPYLRYLATRALQADKVLYHNALNKDKDVMNESYVVDFIVAAVDNLVATKGSEYDTHRNQYTADLCRAAMGVGLDNMNLYWAQGEWDPNVLECAAAIATSIGDWEMLRSSISSSTDLFEEPERNIFPSALAAAACSHDTAILKWQLEYIIQDMSGPKGKDVDWVGWPWVRVAIIDVVNAFKVAIDRHQADEGDVLFNALVKLTSLELDISDIREQSYNRLCQVWTEVYFCAAKDDSIELMLRVLREFETATGTTGRYKLRKRLVDHLFSFGSLDVFCKHLDDGYIDPNQTHSGRTLVGQALKCQREDIAELLLVRGADINTLGPDRGVTALWHAADGLHYRTVFFLLSHGAEPNFPDHTFKSPLRRAKKGAYNKTRFLLELAMTEEGKAQIRNEGFDVMERYKDSFRKQPRKERFKNKMVKPTMAPPSEPGEQW